MSGGCVGLDGQAPPFVINQGTLKRPALGFPDAAGLYEETDGNNLCIETAGVKRARFDANGLNMGTHSISCGAMSSSSMTLTDLEVTHSFTCSNTNSAFATFQGNTAFNKGITVLNAGIVNQGVLNNTGYAGTFGALTTTSIDNGTGVLQTGYKINRLQFPTVLAAAAWYKAGNWTSTQQGANFKMELVAGRNYGASTDMSTMILYSRMFNVSAVTPNIFGHFYTVSTVSTISSPIQRAKWKATTANGTTCQSWDLYVLVETYLGPDHFYTVDVGPNGTWTHIMTADSDPGSDSTTVIACRANAALGCPSNTAGGSALYFGIVGNMGISQYVGSTNVEFAGTGGKNFYVPVDCGTNTLTCGAATCSTMNCTTGLTLPTSGGTAETMNYYEAGSFSATFQSSSGTGGTTYTQTVYFVAIGNSSTGKLQVSLLVPPFTITTSNATTSIQTSTAAVPSRIRPIITSSFVVSRVRSNVTFAYGLAFVSSAGYITFYYDVAGAGFPLSTVTSGAHDACWFTYLI